MPKGSPSISLSHARRLRSVGTPSRRPRRGTTTTSARRLIGRSRRIVGTCGRERVTFLRAEGRSGPLSPLPMQTLVLTLSAHAIKLTKLWASAGPSRHLAIGTISFGTLASESSARTELPSADGMNKRKARSSRRDQARIGESNSALGKEPWYKRTWVIVSTTACALGFILVNGPQMLSNARIIPDQVRETVASFKSWLYEDSEWTGSWSDHPCPHGKWIPAFAGMTGWKAHRRLPSSQRKLGPILLCR